MSTTPASRRLAVVATSARLLTQLATREGYAVMACDLYGDADTRAAAAAWAPLGDGASSVSGIAAQRVLAALDEAASAGALGWLAGSGFDALPELLAAGAARLPLIGAGAGTVRRLRDWRWFFDRADAHGIAHPAVRADAPAEPGGWLRKDAASTGGWGVVDAAAAASTPPGAPSATRYWQRRVDGTPMSATLLAGDGDVLVLGPNRQHTVRIGDRPHVHAGLVGPVALPPEAAHQVARAARLLAADAALRGLASLDFVLDRAGRAQVLEINPRPSASSAAYAGAAFLDDGGATQGLIGAHIAACRHGRLPRPLATASPLHAAAFAVRTVYAPRRLALGAGALRLLDGWPCCHDRPAAPVVIPAGEPLCTLTASGDPQSLDAQLARQHQQLLLALGELT